MITELKAYTMNKFDPKANNNKVWIGTAFSDGTMTTKWGRVRADLNLQEKTKSYGSAFEAERQLEIKYREKLSKGYRETEVFTGITQVTTVVGNLGEIAKKQIVGTEDETTAKLIEYFAQVNIHNITTATSIKYDAANASFSTPLGVLTPDAVSKARSLLGQIQNLNKTRHVDQTRERAINDYFFRVPKDFGMKIPPIDTLLRRQSEIDEQAAILDALEVALTQNQPQTQAEQVFECKLVKVPHRTDDGKATFRRIRTLFEKTKNAMHTRVSTLKLVRVYEVEIPTMKAAFEEKAAEIGNVRTDLWHGSKASNLLSILKQGLIIPPANAVQCTGRMFGNGIYTSLQSSKALNYATNMWNGSGSHDMKRFMFLCEAALGKMHKPASSGRNFPVSGSDSTWVEPNTAGVLNHEAIVYSTDQINLKYLCEFE